MAMVLGPDILHGLGSLSYPGIFGISLVANILAVIPEEAVLLGLGYATRAGEANIFYVIPIIILGLLISDLILYTLSWRGSRFIRTLYDKLFSKRLAFFSRKLDGKQQWMETHIEKVIFYSRFLMQLRFLGPFMAGQMKVPLRKFLVYELAALVIYVPLLVWIGWYFRSRVELVIGNLEQVHTVLLLFVLTIILLPLILSYIRRFFRRATPDEKTQNPI
jgi:membrane protein DedA with SNARE-associated domain